MSSTGNKIDDILPQYINHYNEEWQGYSEWRYFWEVNSIRKTFTLRKLNRPYNFGKIIAVFRVKGDIRFKGKV